MKLKLILSLLALGLPTAPSFAQSANPAWFPYQPANWVDGSDRNGVPCRAVRSDPQTCIALLASQLRMKAFDIANHAFHTRADLEVAMTIAALGIDRGATLVCSVAQHSSPAEATDLAAWVAECPVAQKLQTSAAASLAAELDAEQHRKTAVQDARVADARAVQKQDEDNDKAAALAKQAERARLQAEYEHDLAVFRTSLPVRKNLGDDVCEESGGLVDRAGQVDQVKGDLLQIRYQAGGTAGQTVDAVDSFGNVNRVYIPGQPATDHLRWVASNKVGLCKYGQTPAIRRYECEFMATGMEIIGMDSKAFCAMLIPQNVGQ